MIKSRDTQKKGSSSHYDEDPSALKIDHFTGAPRPAKSKKRVNVSNVVPTVDPDEGDDSVRAKRRRRRAKEAAETGAASSTSPRLGQKSRNKKPRSVASAKRRAERLKSDIPTEEELLAEMPKTSTSQEQEHLDEYLHMFRKLKRLTRKAERDCLTSDNPRGYYAVCTLYSAQREVIADIRSVTDMSGQVAYIEEHVLQPMTRSLGQNLLDSFYQVRKLLIETSKPAETQFALAKYEELTKEQGKYLQSVYEDANSKVAQFMLGGGK